MADIVERLRFDAARCEAQFSKGVATNIEEAADQIAALTSRAEQAERELARIRGLPRLADLDAEIERLRAALQRIDAINDNPAVYNSEINAVVERALSPEQRASDQ